MMNEDASEAGTAPDTEAVIRTHLPFLRRFGRALTGSQAAGDGMTARALEAIISGGGTLDPALPPRTALFRVFCRGLADGTEAFSRQADEVSLHQAGVQRRMEGLDPKSRAALLLARLEDFSTGDVAAILDVSRAEAQAMIDRTQAEIERQTAARILIVEDEPIIAMDIESIVLELGHTSLGIADTRDEAVSMAATTLPDLILSDIRLADESSGVEAARDILARFEVPIIFITAYPEKLLTGQRPEPTFLITKPFKRAAVQAAVWQALFFGTTEAIQL